jgi:hypothetical protein
MAQWLRLHDAWLLCQDTGQKHHKVKSIIKYHASNAVVVMVRPFSIDLALLRSKKQKAKIALSFTSPDFLL